MAEGADMVIISRRRRGDVAEDVCSEAVCAADRIDGFETNCKDSSVSAQSHSLSNT